MNWLILTLSLVAGVAGTGVGGIIGALFKNRTTRTMGRVLSFAGGVMAGVVSFEMLPEAIAASVGIGKIGGIAVCVGTSVVGMAGIYAVNKLLDFAEKKRRAKAPAKVCVLAHSRIGMCLALSNNASEHRKRDLIKAGTVMLIAIALHNFPEGMAIGASGTLQLETGILVALVIAMHNIPEGMAISAPLVSGGVKGIKAVLLTALAGGATVLGALLGLLVGGLGDIATGVCISLASGAMLYVTFCDILPQSTAMNDGEMPSVSFIAGMIFSIIFVFAI